MAFVPDTGAFEASRRNIEDEYAADSATRAYSRFITQQRGQRNLTDMSKGFRQQTPRFTSQFAQRGLAGPGVRSGVMNRAMQQYVGGFNTDYARSQQDLTQQMQQYDLEQARLDAWKSNSLADLEMQKQQEIARAAMNLEALRPYLGGYG